MAPSLTPVISTQILLMLSYVILRASVSPLYHSNLFTYCILSVLRSVFGGMHFSIFEIRMKLAVNGLS